MMPIVSLLLAAVLLASACSDGRASDDDPDTLPPPIEKPTSTTLSYAVPATIDVAYAQHVMRALDHVYGEAVRGLARSRVVDEEFLKPLVAIHNPRSFGLAQDGWVKLQARGFPGLRAAPLDPETRIERLLRADATCIVIEGDRSLAPLFEVDHPTNHHRFVALTPISADRNPSGFNVTPWTMNFDGQGPGGTLPEDACEPQ